MIDKLADFKFDYPTTTHDLRDYINNLLGVSKFVFSSSSSICASILSWVDHLDSNERLYEDKFEGDSLFGIKICLTIDRSYQLFFQSYQAASNISETNFGYLDFNFDQECIERGRFTCNPPAPLLEMFSSQASSSQERP